MDAKAINYGYGFFFMAWNDAYQRFEVYYVPLLWHNISYCNPLFFELFKDHYVLCTFNQPMPPTNILNLEVINLLEAMPIKPWFAINDHKTFAT